MKQFLFCLFISIVTCAAKSQNLGKLYTYSNKSTAGYFYTVDWNVLKQGKGDFKQEKIIGVIHKAEDKGTSPVYAYQHQWGGNHFYTINEDEIQSGEYGYHLLGIAFYAYKKKVPGAVAVHRYFHQQKRIHFYSRLYAKQLNGYGYEGIAFYIFPDEKTAKASAKKKDAVAFMPRLVTKPIADEEPPRADLLGTDKMDELSTAMIGMDPFDEEQTSDHYVWIWDTEKITDFSVSWKPGSETDKVIISSNNKDVLVFLLPPNDGKPPAEKIYTIVDHSQDLDWTTKGSAFAAVETNMGLNSLQGGILKIREKDGKLHFNLVGEYIIVMHPKTKQVRRLKFAFSLPL